MNLQRSHLPCGAYNSIRTMFLCQLCSEARPGGLCCNATQDLTYHDLPRCSHSLFGSIFVGEVNWRFRLKKHPTTTMTRNANDSMLYALDLCINPTCSSLCTVDLMPSDVMFFSGWGSQAGSGFYFDLPPSDLKVFLPTL